MAAWAGVLCCIAALHGGRACAQLSPGPPAAPGETIAPTSEPPPPVQGIPNPASYVLRPGDSVYISLSLPEGGSETTPSAGVAIPPDGHITFYSVTAMAAGRTVAQLQADLLAGIKRYIRNPTLSVNLIFSPYRIISINGAVDKPNDYIYREGMTVFDALTLAGGLKATASKQALIHRLDEKGDPQFLKVDLVALYGGDAAQDIRLQPGDKVLVQDAVIYVDGFVKTPGMFAFRGADNVSRAIAIAGGPVGDADLRNAYIRRGDKTVPVDLRPIIRGGADPVPSPELEPGDILTVPPLEGKVTVVGDVSNTGPVALVPRERDKLLQVLAQAGGTTRTADITHILLRRNVNGTKQVTIPLNLGPDGPPSDDVILQDGDVIYVPTKRERNKTETLFTASLLAQFFITLRNL